MYSSVIAFDSDITAHTITPLNTGKYDMGSSKVGNYAIFSEGTISP
jgi:hypothetical protein